MKDIVRGRLKQFEIKIEHRSGTLADVCETLASSGVNIKAISTELVDGLAIVKVVTADENSTRNSLGKGGFGFEVSDIIKLGLMDRPGELGKVARMLAREGVNIDSVYILGNVLEKNETEVALKVSDLNKALGVLK